MMLPLAKFDFAYPEELVATEPAEPRDAARLMVVDRAGARGGHRVFRELPELLQPGDCLVLNRTKVVAARLAGRKATGGKAELLLARELEAGLWAALAQGLKPGARLEFAAGLQGAVEGFTADGEYVCRFSRADMSAYLAEHGLAPLPPYILKRRKALGLNGEVKDRDRYQTVFGREPGSIAAPTAGLHFTAELLEALSRRGVAVAHLTLHVGRGTFKPIEAEDAAGHRMLPEWFSLAAPEARLISRAAAAGGRVIAVGTTATRTLETLAARPEGFGPGEGWTDLYIRPGHEFKLVSGLVTNFHLPRSTPLLLASAFLGREKLLSAYEEAFRERYRLFSYGDAMLIL